MPEETSGPQQSQTDQSVGQVPVSAGVGDLQTEKPKQEIPKFGAEANEPESPAKPWIGRRWWEAAKQSENSNRIIALATLAVALATIVSTYEIVTGSNDTKKIVASAADIKNALNTANSQNQDALGKTLRENRRALRRTLRQSQEAMDASNNQSKTALDATIADSKLDQRAWVGMIRAVLTPDTTIKADSDAVIGIVIENTGKTPALNTKPTVHWNLLGPSDPLVPPSPKFAQSVTVFFPNSPVVISTEKVRFSATELEYMKQGTQVFKVWGEISYDDIFKNSHWTHFCTYLVKDLTGINACEEYNETDDQKKKAN